MKASAIKQGIDVVNILADTRNQLNEIQLIKPSNAITISSDVHTDGIDYVYFYIRHVDFHYYHAILGKFVNLSLFNPSKTSFSQSDLARPLLGRHCVLAYSKTWPRPAPLAWPGLVSKLAVLKIGLAQNVGLASKIGLASNLLSAKNFGLKLIFICSLHIC